MSFPNHSFPNNVLHIDITTAWQAHMRGITFLAPGVVLVILAFKLIATWRHLWHSRIPDKLSCADAVSKYKSLHVQVRPHRLIPLSLHAHEP